ncbi:MAG: PEGA domain-containing protein [Vicinamibacterales bacterium]
MTSHEPTMDGAGADGPDRPRSRRTLVLAMVGALALAGLAFLLWPSSPAPPPRTESSATAPAPAPPAPTARAETPRESAPTTPTVKARPKPAAEAAAPTPAPVEEKPAELGTLRIESDVPGAQIFIDRKFVGNAPVTAEALTPGTHQLNASAEGFEGIARPIDVSAGTAELTVRFKEVRLAESIDVVHKKAFGSTMGKLVATPEGLRFETADPKDGFEAKLTDLTQFEVDYLKKNLKVKLKNGKTFNFTDKNGNADALFVFHRNVDKVRGKVAGSGSGL